MRTNTAATLALHCCTVEAVTLYCTAAKNEVRIDWKCQQLIDIVCFGQKIDL